MFSQMDRLVTDGCLIKLSDVPKGENEGKKKPGDNRVKYKFATTSRVGFFSKIFGGGDSKENANPGHRFTVQLESEGEQIRVTVDVASEMAAGDTDSLILKERLLKLIKEYST